MRLALSVVLPLAACSGGDAPPIDAATSATPILSLPRTERPDELQTTATSAAAPGPTAASTTSTLVESTSGSLEDAGVALAQRARKLFEARAQANAGPVPNPDNPLLAESATGAALVELRAEATRRRDGGQAVRPASPSAAAIRVGFVEAAGESATVAACRVDDAVVYDVASGQVVNEAVGTQHFEIDLLRLDGSWKVVSVTLLQRWEGVAGCALAVDEFPY